MISHNQIYAMPYAWREEYNEDKVKVYYDQDKKLPYCQIVDSGVVKIYTFQLNGKRHISRDTLIHCCVNRIHEALITILIKMINGLTKRQRSLTSERQKGLLRFRLLIRQGKSFC